MTVASPPLVQLPGEMTPFLFLSCNYLTADLFQCFSCHLLVRYVDGRAYEPGERTVPI